MLAAGPEATIDRLLFWCGRRLFSTRRHRGDKKLVQSPPQAQLKPRPDVTTNRLRISEFIETSSASPCPSCLFLCTLVIGICLEFGAWNLELVSDFGLRIWYIRPWRTGFPRRRRAPPSVAAQQRSARGGPPRVNNTARSFRHMVADRPGVRLGSRSRPPRPDPANAGAGPQARPSIAADLNSG